MALVNIDNFRGGLNLNESTTLDDNQFEVLQNMFYTSDKRIQSRRGLSLFGNSIWTQPITSYFFYIRDDTQERIALATAWTDMYRYNETTSNWTSIKSWLAQFESNWVTRTRWDFAVYKNVVYMCNGVDAYASYDWTTYTELGLSNVSWTPTFDNTTNTVTLTGHSLTNNTSVRITGWTLPAWLTRQFYYVVNVQTNTFQLSLRPNGTPINFTDNWSWTLVIETTSQPRVRYIEYLGDRIFAAWDDSTPITLYYTGATPADGTDLTGNVLIVWWDELGVINWLKELWNIILVFKDKQIYSVDVASSSSVPTDPENWAYWNRAIQRVANALVYFNDRGFETLKQRSGVSWTGALESKPLSDDVRKLTSQVPPRGYNSTIWTYILPLTNYYSTFDTTGEWIPETTLVYSSLTKTWSQYSYPAINDYGEYIDSNWDVHYVAASANSWQMYEIESGFSDLNLSIPCELHTKRWDFGDNTLFKTFSYVDLVGLKSEGDEISVNIFIDEEIAWWGTITDANINVSNTVLTVWTAPIWNRVVWWGWTSEVPLYLYRVRIPLEITWTTIQIRMDSNSTNLVWTLDKATINKNNEDLNVFDFDNII